MRLIDADAYEFPGDLSDEPTITFGPIVDSEWVRGICKRCGFYWGSVSLATVPPFCPSCGANMGVRYKPWDIIRKEIEKCEKEGNR